MVTLAFQGSGVVNPTDRDRQRRHYHLDDVPVGTYAKLRCSARATPHGSRSRSATAGATVDFAVHKDLATRAAGASINSATGLDFAGCGPSRRWTRTRRPDGAPTSTPATVARAATFHSKNMVVALDGLYDVTGFGIDPSAACGDGASASTAGYQIETSDDGQTWTDADSGTFTSADDGRINALDSGDGATRVQFVRLTLTSNQTPSFASNCPNGGYSGCLYVDLTEFEIYGTPAP